MFGFVNAVVHEPGVAVVGLRALTTVLGGLAAPSPDATVELRVEGGRLAIRTPSARFALPLIAAPATARPDVPVLGVATGFREAASIVADVTAKDGLPLFTAVRIRSDGDRLTLVATDRFRAAVATLPWRAGAIAAQVQGATGDGGAMDAASHVDAEHAGAEVGDGPRGHEDYSDAGHGDGGAGRRAAEVDALVPAAALANAVRFAGREVPIRAADGWFGVDWSGGGTIMPQLAMPFPDAQINALLSADPITTIDVEADALLSAVDRVAPFAPDGIVLDIADGVICVRGSGELGEAREDVKASTAGDHATMRYQPRYLAAAVRAYAGRGLTMQVQQGIRPTVFRGESLIYLVVPLRSPSG